jgi:transposase
MPEERTDLFGELASEPAPRKKAPSKPVFKKYEQHQAMLLPPSVEELIPAGHLVRTVNRTIDALNIDALLETYTGGGASAFHPLMMLKVLVYAYVSKTYSSRRIAKALREDINYMWLSGMQQVDFRTINLFRAGRLKDTIDAVFGSLVLFLDAHQYINLRDYFVDGTKQEANANRHSHVWRKNTARYKERLQERIRELLTQIDEANRQEDAQYGDQDLPELGEHVSITSEELKEQTEKLNAILDKLKPPKEVTKALSELQEKHLPKLEAYERQERLLDGRNSYAKTDPDATFFRLKSGELRPSYNVIIGTQKQFLLNYTIHRKASETDRFIEHLEKFHAMTGRWPQSVIGDPAYGSEENYAFLQHHGIAPYLRYNTYAQDIKGQGSWALYDRRNFAYHPATDTYRCPEGRTLAFKTVVERTTANGFVSSARLYESLDCRGCPVARACKKGRGPRTLQRNDQLERFKAVARMHLASKKGRMLYRNRGTEVESVHGDLKHNQQFRRFHLRGLLKVNVEMALLAIGHNIKKMVKETIN